ncbi:hypothetical protein ZIOFF_040182 [Zingiber officinale]|uniref:Uncharacterized protein n=1 Tax=Zingiber officinale TaxID=94328 RepID=A0A8J5G8C3_ZINOF|nr:hypothetical protein ZIOFF_040182 [Zingiber officinale]
MIMNQSIIRNIVGIIGNVISCGLFLSPILLVITINSIGIAFELFYLTVFLIYAARQGRKLVIQTKSVEFMPFTLSLASFLNGVCWTSYGFLPFDINLLVPNGLGTLFGLAQLVLYACYFKSTSNKDARAEVELPV